MKQRMTKGIEVSNQNHRTLGEKETYKYLRILKADNIKQVENEKSIPNKIILQESHQRDRHLG